MKLCLSDTSFTHWKLEYLFSFWRIGILAIAMQGTGMWPVSSADLDIKLLEFLGKKHCTYNYIILLLEGRPQSVCASREDENIGSPFMNFWLCSYLFPLVILLEMPVLPWTLAVSNSIFWDMCELFRWTMDHVGGLGDSQKNFFKDCHCGAAG